MAALGYRLDSTDGSAAAAGKLDSASGVGKVHRTVAFTLSPSEISGRTGGTLRRYGSNKEMEVEFVNAALLASGFTIESEPSPHEAPFIWQVVTPRRRGIGGERLRLICYLFHANKYRQEKRTLDEHRFQIKYGGDLSGLHELYMPQQSDEVTLFFGCHLEEGIFVAADPAMHNPTRFSVSVEFKDRHVAGVKEGSGWMGWERARSEARRVVFPMENQQIEVLLGLTPERFADYVELERFAVGLDAGQRLLAIDKMESPIRVVSALHDLESEFGLTSQQILDVIQQNFRLKVAVRGSVAQRHLEQWLASIPRMRVRPLDEDGQPDFLVSYAGGRERLIECKNVLRRKNKEGAAVVDFQRTRASIEDRCSRYYRRNEFDILAACVQPVTERWEFRFAPTSALDAHKTCADRMSPRVAVAGSSWTDDITRLLRG